MLTGAKMKLLLIAGAAVLTFLFASVENLSPTVPHAEDRWVQATVTDDERPERALERLKTRFPHVLVFRHEPAGGRRTRERTYADALRQAPSDLALTTGFVDHVRERAASPAEAALLQDALEASRLAEVRA